MKTLGPNPHLTEGSTRACAGQVNVKSQRDVSVGDCLKAGICFTLGFAGLALGLVSGYVWLHGFVAVQCTLPEVPIIDRDLACWLLETLY